MKEWTGKLDDFNPDEFCDNDDETCIPMIFDNIDEAEVVDDELAI